MKLVKIQILVICLGMLVVGSVAQAGSSHGSSHDDSSSQIGTDHHEKASMQGGNHGSMGGHAHDKWETPPKEYASLVAKNWENYQSFERGEKLYSAQCQACHGFNGKGTGPAASALEHAPADLTNNFHTAPGKGDGYLFWRVSEGGQ